MHDFICMNENRVVFISFELVGSSMMKTVTPNRQYMRKIRKRKKNVNCSDRILTCRIKSICSPAKGGTGCYRFNYQPGS